MTCAPGLLLLPRRLSLIGTGLAAGPAMVCVLSPPSSITAVASAPAGVSPAVAALLAAQQGHQPTDSSSAAGCLQPARLWACLPLLVVSSTEVQHDLQKLFDGMCRELQQSADTCSSPGPSSISTSSSSQAAQLVSVQHWQPFLWDWLYAAHGADASSMLGCIPQLAGSFRAPAFNAVPLLGSTHEPAAVWAMDTSGSSSSSRSMAVPTKQAVLSTLLDLLVTHECWAAVQQLQAATAPPAQAAPASEQGSPLTDSNSSSIHPLSLTAGSRHDSCDSYNQIHASAGMPGWRPPVHCRDAAVPPLSLRKQALQEQQAKYVHTLEEDVTPAQHSCPASQSRRQSLEGAEVQQAGDPGSSQPAAGNGGSSSSGCSPRGEDRQPAARRASASAAMAATNSAGLFTPHRMSLDSLPLPHASAGADTELLRPPRWSVDLPLANDVSLQQHLQQQQQLFIPPSAMFSTGMFSTTSPPAAGALGAFGHPGHPAAGAPGLASPLLTHDGTAAAAAAAAGAAAAQAALLHLNPGSFGSSAPGSSLPSPAAAMRQASGPHSGPGSASRQYPHSVPVLNPALAHMHPQPSLGYSPSLASTASGGTSLFMTAADAAAAAAAASGAMGSSVQGASPAGLDHRRVQQEAAPGSEDAAPVEGRHWAVFDTTGVEGFDQGMPAAHAAAS